MAETDKKNELTTTRVKIALVVVSTLVALAGIEFAVRITLPCPIPGYRYDAPQKYFFEYNADLGWSGKPGAKGKFRSFDFDVYVEHDKAGFRNDNPPYVDGKRNVIVIGDSFGWGWGVNNHQLFSRVMMRTDKTLNVYNLSAPGYGTGQQLLVLKKFLATSTDEKFDNIVLLFYPANDYDDVAANVRFSYPKPVFVNDNGVLRVANVPVPEKDDVFAVSDMDQPVAVGSTVDRILRSSHVYNRIIERRRILTKKKARIDLQIRTPKPTAVDLAHLLVAAIGDEALSRSAKFSVIIITRRGSGIEEKNARYLLDFLEEAGITHARFNFGMSSSLCIDSHTNAKGHGEIASQIIRLLGSASPLE